MSLTETTLLQRMMRGEDRLTERKVQGVNRSDLRRSLVALANSVDEYETAVIFVGVEDDGELAGVDNTDELQKRVRQAASEDCYPAITTNTIVLEVEGKNIVAVQITFSANRPHFSGPAYVRSGSESVKASSQQFKELIDSRHDKTRWILRHKGEYVTVVWRPLPETVNQRSLFRYGTKLTYLVVSCDAFCVRLSDDDEHLITVPLERVTISRDEKQRRALLEIMGSPIQL